MGLSTHRDKTYQGILFTLQHTKHDTSCREGQALAFHELLSHHALTYTKTGLLDEVELHSLGTIRRVARDLAALCRMQQTAGRSMVDELFHQGMENVPEDVLDRFDYHPSTFSISDLPGPPESPPPFHVSHRRGMLLQLHRSIDIVIQDIDHVKENCGDEDYKWADEDRQLRALQLLIWTYSLSMSDTNGITKLLTAKEFLRILSDSWRTMTGSVKRNINSLWKRGSRYITAPYQKTLRTAYDGLTSEEGLLAYNPDTAIWKSSDVEAALSSPIRAQTSSEISAPAYSPLSSPSVLPSPVSQLPVPSASQAIDATTTKRKRNDSSSETDIFDVPPSPQRSIDTCQHQAGSMRQLRAKGDANVNEQMDPELFREDSSIGRRAKFQSMTLQDFTPSVQQTASQGFGGVTRRHGHQPRNVDDGCRSRYGFFTRPSKRQSIYPQRHRAPVMLDAGFDFVKDAMSKIKSSITDTASDVLRNIGALDLAFVNTFAKLPDAELRALYEHCYGSSWQDVAISVARGREPLSKLDCLRSLLSSFVFTHVLEALLPWQDDLPKALPDTSPFRSWFEELAEQRGYDNVDYTRQCIFEVASTPNFRKDIVHGPAVALSDLVTVTLEAHVDTLNEAAKPYRLSESSDWKKAFGKSMTQVLEEAFVLRTKIAGCTDPVKFSWPSRYDDVDPITMSLLNIMMTGSNEQQEVAYTVFPGVELVDLNGTEARSDTLVLAEVAAKTRIAVST